MKIRALDLFCGAGGSSWGARQAGVEVTAAFDLWPIAGKTHDANFPESEFVLGRLEDLDLKSISARIGPIDLILASPECTNHSPAKGGRPRSEASKETAFQVVRFASCFRPRWVVIENVVNMRRWRRYSEFKESLSALGYQMQEQVLDSAHFGVPQSRRRLFLFGDLLSCPRLLSPSRRKIRNAAEIVDLGETYAWTPLRRPTRSSQTIARAERGFAQLGEATPFLLVYYGSDGAGGWQDLNRPLRTITTLDRFAIVKPDPRHGHVMRMLQVAELQAAMGMPPSMRLIGGTRRDRIRMIGNAVCPPVMRRLVEQLTKSHPR